MSLGKCTSNSEDQLESKFMIHAGNACMRRHT